MKWPTSRPGRVARDLGGGGAIVCAHQHSAGAQKRVVSLDCLEGFAPVDCSCLSCAEHVYVAQRGSDGLEDALLPQPGVSVLRGEFPRRASTNSASRVFAPKARVFCRMPGNRSR